MDSIDIQDKIKNFTDILEKIKTLDDKKRSLWLDIYNNALTDRANSYAMFLQLCGLVNGKSTEWAIHGKTISTFIEKMEKANDQIIKLAELVERAEEKGKSEFNADDIFSQMDR